MNPRTDSPLSHSAAGRRFQGRAVVCWHCQTHFQALPNAPECQCPQCQQTLSLADEVVMDQSVRRIQTQGELRLLKDGFLVAGDSCCGTLRLMGGSFAGRVRCSGEARVEATETSVPGELTCEKLVVAKKTSVIFDKPLSCAEAEIQGSFQGELICSGVVRLGKDAHLAGHCRARALNMESGSVLAASVSLTGAGRARPSAAEAASSEARTESQNSTGPIAAEAAPHQRQLPEVFYQTALPQPV